MGPVRSSDRGGRRSARRRRGGRVARVLGALALVVSGASGAPFAGVPAGTSALPLALADVVHLEGGGRLEGKVEDRGDRIRVVFGKSAITVPKSSVVRIDAAETPEEAIARRRDGLREGDAAGALSIASDAARAGLREVAEEALRLAERWAPDDVTVRSAARRLRNGGEERPEDDPAALRLAAEFGPGARVLVTTHFVVAYDVPEEVARSRAARLEATWARLYGWGEDLGLAPHAVDRRFEVLLFADHARWLAAAGRTEGLDGTTGLYASSTGRVLLYDLATAPFLRAAAAPLATRRTEIETARTLALGDRTSLASLTEARDALSGTAADRERRRALEAEIGATRARIAENDARIAEAAASVAAAEADLAAFAEREGLATASHEAAHQISFAAGICRPLQPLWLTEGLATLFEAGDAPAPKPSAPNEARLRDLREAWKEGRRTSLADLVTDVSLLPVDEKGAPLPRTLADRAVAYAEAWSLCHHLALRRPREFSAYVRSCRPALPGSPAAREQRLREFEDTFGPLDTVERAWHAHVDALPPSTR